VPWSAGDWVASIDGVPQDQTGQGAGDAWVGVDWLFHGAPAMQGSEFENYVPGRVFGAGLRLSLPSGDYNPEDLVNLGSNRWSLRAELAASQAWGRWTLEGVAGVRVFGKNKEFLVDRTLEQDPLYSVKGSLIYSFKQAGWWTGFSLGYGQGGRTEVNGVPRNTKQRNWRFGAAFSMPLAPRHGLSLRFNTGVNDGAGGDFDTVSLVYTYQTLSIYR